MAKPPHNGVIRRHCTWFSGRGNYPQATGTRPDAGLFGGSGPTALLPALPSGVGEAREQTAAVGEDASAVLCLCPGVDAAPVRSPLVWLEEDGPHFGVGFLLIATHFPK